MKAPDNKEGSQEDITQKDISKTSDWSLFWAGLIGSLSVPALVLFMSFVGYGALARDAGFSPFLAMFSAATIYALPALVVLADQTHQGAGLATVAIAITLTSIRLLPLTAAFVPILRHEKMPLWLKLFASHFMAVTLWVDAMRRLPAIEPGRRLPYYLGLCAAFMSAALSGNLTGYFLASVVPPVIQSGLLFLTPMYFFLSLLVVAATTVDRAAVFIGIVLGPLFFTIAPGFDLVLTGLIGGTLAYGGSRWILRRS